ncbi:MULTISPECIES: H-NS histone family protein [unclassified Lysobacter]|uniref:H-NS histone family protein n=1 Tax=unclassified Lysobacter TaxID=2635362 RepID=UPI001BE7AEC7|nr:MULTISPECIES: H-NS histone family protein [unclassified Lysobacter]MBT2748765.1 H-NS histone family protein [Lysobacter sp. ISL-42]MBT2751700.1 H-NS histone family protein [Lysobacter sp. ISL-50]MBT2775894.1 H-NS histone family protein [Lysobacter sp. ISL-54]MBT2782142.1 H-NS histone family protein [Lysobacter sp. ISL-52]
MNIDVEKLSLRELTALLVAAEKRRQWISSRNSVATVRRKVVALAAQSGYTIEELYGDQPVTEIAAKKRGARRKPGKVAAKYRDPDNKRNTWSGRGRMPRWLAQKTKHGRSVTDFLIPGLGRPTARKSSTIGRRTLVKQG